MASKWYLFKNGVQSGPLSWEQLAEQGKTGHIKPGDFVWTEGMENWIRADHLKGLITAPPPAPPDPFSAPKSGPPPLHQQRGARNHRAAPAQRRGKGGLIALVVVLVVVLLGGGYFAFNTLLPAAPAMDTGQDQLAGEQSEVYISGLWAQPLVPAYIYSSEFIEDSIEAGIDIEKFKDDYLTQLTERLPRENEVPHPLYPGALAYGANPTMANEELQRIYLLTTDTMDSVLDFYKNHLTGWQSEVLHDGGHILWEGDPEDYTAALAMSIDSIIIREPNVLELNSMPNARTYISLVYSPN